MITVYFVRGDKKIPVTLETGNTLMEAAKFYSKEKIPEIEADCGGTCSCGTCHVYIDDKWSDKLGEIDTTTPEIDILEYEPTYIENKSRLSCQIELKPEHDGLTVRLL